MKKLFALLLAVLMMVSLTACNKEAADIDDVIDFMDEEEFEYHHFEDAEYLEDGMEEAVSGYREDIDTLQFIVFEDEDEAKDYFEEMVEDAEDELDPDKTVTKSIGNYDYAAFTGDDQFAVISRIGDTILLGICAEDDSDELKDIFEEFGY